MIDYALTTVGSQGAGKTFLINNILGKDTFEHRFHHAAVTTIAEHINTSIKDKCVQVWNTPGLMDSDPNETHQNFIHLEKALFSQPKCILMFVLECVGGRISSQDIETLKHVMKSYGVHPQSVCVVVNKVKTLRRADFDEVTKNLLKSMLELDTAEICFVDEVDPADWEARIDVGRRLKDLVSNCVPNKLTKTQITFKTPQDLLNDQQNELNRFERVKLQEEEDLVRRKKEEKEKLANYVHPVVFQEVIHDDNECAIL